MRGVAVVVVAVVNVRRCVRCVFIGHIYIYIYIRIYSSTYIYNNIEYDSDGRVYVQRVTRKRMWM